MADINVNTVYQTVLSILNKEQRGYLTPFEFNQVGEQAQLEIFESYFENLNQQLRNPGNDSEYANRIKLLEEKINRFQTSEAISITQGAGEYWASGSLITLPSGNEVHRLGTIEYNYGSELPVELQEVTVHEWNLARRSRIAAPSNEWPIFYVIENSVRILPANVTTVTAPTQNYTINYIKKPQAPVWNYTVGGVGQYIFDPVSNGVSKNFQISDVDQTELILSILRYAGVIIKDTEVVQIASGLVNQQDQLEQA